VWAYDFAQRVLEGLSRIVSLRGAPRYLRSGDGPEFAARSRPTEQAEAVF
jgi:hypothetical protein